MKFLLDTHTFLWSLLDNDKLSKTASDILANPENDVMVSAITYWEVSLKYALGKLELFGLLPDELPDYTRQLGFAVLPLASEDAATFYKLPLGKHKDPFDRLIIWQAIRQRIPLISKDKNFPSYRAHGLNVIWN